MARPWHEWLKQRERLDRASTPHPMRRRQSFTMSPKRFEDYDPAEGDQVRVEEYLLRRAVPIRARSQREIVDAVAAARSAGISWNKIGEILGTSA